MKNLVHRIAAILLAALVSSPALAAISYSEDFEGLNAADSGALGAAGWLVFANAFSDYPGCSAYVYGYGPFPAPNGGPGFSSIVTGTSSGQALNAYSDYNNGDHGIPFCIEANVFQERAFVAADAGTYEFAFDIEVPAPPDDVLGPNVNTFGFVKMLDPGAGFALTLFETVATTTPGSKSIVVELGAEFDGQILQWGFTNTAGDFEASGRWYDNVEFGIYTPPPPRPPSDSDIAIPTLNITGLLLLLALVGGVGAITLTRRS